MVIQKFTQISLIFLPESNKCVPLKTIHAYKSKLHTLWKRSDIPNIRHLTPGQYPYGIYIIELEAFLYDRLFVVFKGLVQTLHQKA
jgi:hypothetical protein